MEPAEQQFHGVSEPRERQGKDQLGRLLWRFLFLERVVAASHMQQAQGGLCDKQEHQGGGRRETGRQKEGEEGLRFRGRAANKERKKEMKNKDENRRTTANL
jgi:hypothetical protein